MKLLHGDCLNLLPSIPDGSVSMVFADLPYAHMSGGKVRKCTANKWDTPIDLAKLWAELLRVGKRNAAFVFTATFKFAQALSSLQPELHCDDLIWNKMRAAGFANASRSPLRCHELLLIFSRCQPTYNAQKTYGHEPVKVRTSYVTSTNGGPRPIGRPSDDSRFPLSILNFKRDDMRGKQGHPTQKPVALLEWLIRTYSNPGDLILDPTAGSFTTGVACVNTGRDFIGIEKDADYFRVGQQRVLDAQQGAA